MVLEFKTQYVSEWKNKLLFAPNGFGKTTSSKRIFTELEKINFGSTLLFTRRRMDDLLNFSKDTFYFGEESKMRMENAEAERKLSKTTSFKQFVKKNYGVTSASNLKNNSFFFNTVGSSNLFLSFLLSQPQEVYEEIVNVDETIELDKELNYELFKDIPLDVRKIKKPKRSAKKILISQAIYEYLDELRIYSESLGLNKCPLCGKKFKNKENLQKAIARTFKKYIVLDSDNPADLIDEIYAVLSSSYISSENNEIKNIFVSSNEGTVDFSDKVATIVNYSNLCKKIQSNMLQIVRNIDVDGKKAGEIVDLYNANQNDINKLSNSANKSKMLSFIESEFKKIANLDDSITFHKDVDNLAISLTVGDNSKPVSAADILSESEAKRLSLAVLRAMIKYGKYDCLILDDPLDSYDDYYMSIVCNYIASLLKEPKLKSFYLFTNNNVALFKLSLLLKCSSVIIYENPDLVFRRTKSLLGLSYSSNFSIINADYKEIEFINQSEINLLSVFLNASSHYGGAISFDPDLSYIAFLTTIRNIKSEVLKRISSLKLMKYSKDFTLSFQNDVRTLVEHCYMHYEPDIAKPFNSLSIKVSDVYNLYNLLIKIKNPNIYKFAHDGTYLNTKRLEQCQKTFSSHSGSEILNLIFKKIIFISELKYEFEKTMIDKLQQKYCFSNIDIEQIVNTDSTGRKLQKIKSINKKYGGIASPFIDECLRIYQDYSSMVNEFDHAMALMFPPYLNTRIIDVLKYKDALDELKSKY